MKQLIGTDIGGYSFDASAKTVELKGLGPLELSQILLIVNATQNVVIYSPVAAATGNAGFDGRILALDYDTSAHADDDSLQIFVDLPAQSPTDITDLLNSLIDTQRQTNEMLFMILNQLQPENAHVA